MTVFTLETAGGQDRTVLGGKGESLVRIRGLGLPVPPAVIAATTVCREYLETGRLAEATWDDLRRRVGELETATGRRLGDPDAPLLVSVRSGAAVSMPGMMDTVLNVGLNELTLSALARDLGDAAAARDSCARLEKAFADLVPGGPLPQDAWQQLRAAVEAVLASWSSPRASRYRRFAGIDPSMGTAVIVQAMVFGNLAERSGTGVAFTRDPATGAPGLYGDFLARAQGEDVVGGEHDVTDIAGLGAMSPDAADDLARAAGALERDFRDLVDIEFTVERGKLWVLQARAGQRSARAAVRIALDLVDDGLIDWDDAMSRVPPEALVRLLDPVLDPMAARDVLGTGLAASPGSGVGVVALTAEEAEELADAGQDVVLVRPATDPRDIAGMVAARGVVTARGGRTSHAAVVARGLSLPAVCGVPTLAFDSSGRARFGDRVVVSGDPISLDGSTGHVYAGALPLIAAPPDPRVDALLHRCDQRRRIPVLAVEQADEWADGVLDPHTPVVAGVDDLAAIGGGSDRVVLAASGDGAPSFIGRAIAAAEEAGTRLVFRVPDVWPPALRELPSGPWAAVAATPKGAPAARLLAATTEPADA